MTSTMTGAALGPSRPDFIVKGWCPGALRPMQSGDGLVVRVRLRGSRLTPAQAAGLARLAAQHGNGTIDLTSRANVQIRGISAATYPALIDGIAALGLLDADPAAEAQRNVVVTPFWSDGDGMQSLAEGLALALTSADAPRLPAKFGFAIDCGASPVLASMSADIRFERDADGQLICRADGAATGAHVTMGDAVQTAMQLARWYSASGGSIDGHGRMATHLERGAVLPAAFTVRHAMAVASPQPRPGRVVRGDRGAIGVLVGFAFGQIQAEALEALAALGPLRVTPWRQVLVEGIDSVPSIAGLITEPDDPLLSVVACPGAPRCSQAQQPTRELSRALAAYVAARLPAGATLHVSGCAKGCAHPGRSTLTLCAQSDGFDLIRDGSAREPAVLSGLDAKALLARPAMLFEEGTP